MFLSVLTYKCSAQSRIIIIDTLVGYHQNIEDSRGFSEHCTSDNSDLQTHTRIVENEHFSSAVISTTGESLCIALDNKGGMATINNIQKLSSDTIRISKWTIYDNGLTDTIIGSKAFYKTVNDEMAEEPYKIVPIHRYKKMKGITSLHSITVKINNKNYTIPVTIEDETLYTSFNGVKPSKAYRQFTSKPKKNRKYRYEKFNGNITTHRKKFNAVLNIN